MQQYTRRREAKVFNAASAGTENAEAARSTNRDNISAPYGKQVYLLAQWLTTSPYALPVPSDRKNCSICLLAA